MFYAHIAGTLTADAVERTTTAGKPYITASVRVPIEREDAALVSVAAFNEEAQEALEQLKKGASVSIAGPAKLRTWVGSDGKEHTSVSMVADRVLDGIPERKPRRGRQAALEARNAAVKWTPPPEDDETSPFPEEAGDLSIIGGKK
jgi:single-stranded DNA-binding protein